MQDLKITLIQCDLAWEDKVRNLAIFSKLIQTAGGTDVIVLPEMFSTGFSMNAKHLAEKMDGHTVTWMQETANKKSCVITGSLIIEEEGKYFNRLIWMKPDGNYSYYDKRHLFSLGDEHNSYEKGNKKLIVEISGWKLCPLVCYDLRFPVWSRNEEDYDVLIYAANWPERRIYAWTQLLIARAIENQCYVIGVNRIGIDGNNIYHSGNSAVINPMGEKLWEVIDERAVYTASLSKQYLTDIRTKLPFLSDRDAFEISI